MNLKLTILLFLYLDISLTEDNKDFDFPTEFYLQDEVEEFRQSLIDLAENSEEEDEYNEFIHQDDKGYAFLSDNSSQLFSQQDYKECRKDIINDINPNIKVPDILAYEKFDTPSKLCPQIKHSCCSKNNLRTLGYHFLTGVKKFRLLFRKINEVYKLYFEKRGIIMDMLKYYMANPVANCINIRPNEVYNLFFGFQNDYVDTSAQVDDYINLLFKYQSGLMCTICDLNYNHLIGEADDFRMIIHWDQCRQLTMNYFLFLPSVYQIYRIAAAVNFIQCQIFEIKDWTINIDFDPFIQEFKEVTDCINQYDNPQGDIRHCLRICKDQTQIGVYNDIPKVLQITNQLQEFYYEILAQAPSLDDEDERQQQKQDIIQNNMKQNLEKEILIQKNITYNFYNVNPYIHEEAYDIYVDKYFGIYPTQMAMQLQYIYEEFGPILKIGISLFILINQV